MNIVNINKSWLSISAVLIWVSLVTAIAGYEYLKLEGIYSGLSNVSLTSEKCIAEEQLKARREFPTNTMIQSWFDHGICVHKIATVFPISA